MASYTYDRFWQRLSELTYAEMREVANRLSDAFLNQFDDNNPSPAEWMEMLSDASEAEATLRREREEAEALAKAAEQNEARQ